MQSKMSIVMVGMALLVWSTSVAAQETAPPRAKVAARLNLSPHQSWVHLFCEKMTAPACGATFWCGPQTGEPVTWNIDVEPGRVFSSWPGKTETDGSAASLEVALV